MDSRGPVCALNIQIVKLNLKMTVGVKSLTCLAAAAILNRALPASERASLLMYGWLTDVVLACMRIPINHS
jgi:hypothetical protein